MNVPSPAALLAAFLMATTLAAACQDVDIDPAVADTPLPRAGDPVDAELAAAGETLYRRSCIACHDRDDALVGPALGNVAGRRSPDWIRAMVLSPDSMLAYDSTARALLDEYMVPMTDLRLDEVRYRAIWEYMRSW